MYNLDCKKGLSVRTAKALPSLTPLEKLWKSKSINLQTKLSAENKHSKLYAYERWVHDKGVGNKNTGT